MHEAAQEKPEYRRARLEMEACRDIKRFIEQRLELLSRNTKEPVSDIRVFCMGGSRLGDEASFPLVDIYLNGAE